MHSPWMNALLLAVVAMASLCGTAAETAPRQQHPDFFPLGVYWPGEFTFRDQQIPKLRWQAIDQTLELLAAHHVNAIWLTHVDAKEGAEFARHAAKRGIYLVASLGELSSENPGVRKSAPDTLVQRVLAAWGDAPAPIAWGLGDEPRAEYMHELANLAAAWKHAGQPTTTVVMPGDAPAAATQLAVSALCTDIYPYFSAGNPNGPDTHAASTGFLLDAGGRVRRWTQTQPGMRYWLMGAIFQEPWGPRELDAQGNLVYLPGGGPHFRMPTPAEVRWESWGALATGAKGLFHFSLFFNPRADPTAKPLGPDLPFGVKERTNSGAPGGMLYMDGRPTPQFTAMGECFARLAKITPVFATLQPTNEFVAFHAKGWPNVGDVVQPFIAPDGTYYLLVVNGNLAADADVPVNVAGEVETVTDVISGHAIPLISTARHSFEPIGKPFRQARVKLAPGDGTLLRLQRAATAGK
jgi:hypothetical protein